jgi:hypothetical protein
MSEALAAAIWLGLAGYLAVGLVIGIGTAAFGMKRLAPAAVPVRVRLLVLPGMAALWPVVLMRLAGAKAPEDRA